MPLYLRYFTWAVYAAIALQFVAALLPGKSWADFAGFAAIAIAVFVLTRALVHEKSKYALWLLLFIFVIDILDTITQLSADGQAAVLLEHSAAGLRLILDVVTNLLELAAVCFLGAARRASRS